MPYLFSNEIFFKLIINTILNDCLSSGFACNNLSILSPKT